MRFNPPPGWPRPPESWIPPAGWKPDPTWPAPPEGWQLWISDLDDPEAATATPEPRIDMVRRTPRAKTAQVPPPLDDRGVLLARITELERQLAAARAGDQEGLIELDDRLMLQVVGIYRYNHPLGNATQYRDRLRDLQRRIDAFVKEGRAVLASDMFTFDGSLAKGRRMLADLSKLMLRTYNAEADNCVRSLRAGNITTAKKRLESSVSAVARLGSSMEMRVNPDFHALHIEELELTADYQMKVQEERERAREEREQLREQRRAEQELAAERERLDKERAHYITVLASLRTSGDHAAADELEHRLGAIDEAIAQNDYRVANIRAGYVYVISNIGAFGPNMVKIGMTRRLEPLDRVRELGSASVPFPYDVHALFFSNDAVTLENELHHALSDRRVNSVNPRREFFFVTPLEVRNLLAEKVGGLLEFTETPEALQYLQSVSSWPSPA